MANVNPQDLGSKVADRVFAYHFFGSCFDALVFAYPPHVHSRLSHRDECLTEGQPVALGAGSTRDRVGCPNAGFFGFGVHC